MKWTILLHVVFTLSVVTCLGQTHIAEHPKILLLNIGSSAWPIKLSKQWFEGDTIYLLTFRNAGVKYFEATDQGFFKFQLKTFAKALETILSLDSNSEVKFSEGVITIMPGKTSKRKIECHFRAGKQLFRANESKVKVIIHAIIKELRQGVIVIGEEQRTHSMGFYVTVA